MHTATASISDELNPQLAKLAEQEDASTHSPILDAITEKSEILQSPQTFHSEACERYKRYLDTGEAIPWEEMRDYLRCRARGESIKPSSARRLGD